MHPVLVEIPLPHWSVPLAPALVVLALAALVAAELGRRSRSADLVWLGLAGAVGALAVAGRVRGQSIQLGELPLYGFGVLLCLALVGGWFLALRLAERDGLSLETIAGCYFATAVAGLAGARVLYVVTNLADFHSVGDVLAVQGGGLAFYGGVLGGFAGSIAYLRPRQVRWLAWADVGAPCLASGSMLGRIGCYLAGCDYGVPLGLGAPRWLVRLGTFPRWPDELAGVGAGSPAWVDHVLYRQLPLDSTSSLPVHPTQIYESAGAAVLLLGLLALRGRRTFRGEVFLAFVAGYGALRFFLEILRDDPERGLYGPRAAPELLVLLGSLVLGVAFLLGGSAAIRSRGVRWAARLAALAMPLASFVLLRGLHRPASQLSTSQWIALATSVAVAIAWRALSGPGGEAGARHGALDGGPAPA